MHGDRSAKLALTALAVIGLVAVALLFREQLFHSSAARDDAAPGAEDGDASATRPVSGARRIAASRASDPDALSGVIRGRVHDEAGASIDGAKVRSIAQDRAPDAPDEPSTAIADSRGRFEIAVRGGAVFSVAAEAAGFAPRHELGVRAGDEVDLTLAAELVVDGSVVDDQGAPVKGAAIAWLGNFGGHEIERSTTSDENGKWRLAGLPRRDSSDRLWAKAEGFAPYVTWRVWTPEMTGVVRFTIVLSRGGRISGTVADARTGAPIPGAKVELARLSTSWGLPLPRRLRSVSEAVADGSGVYRLDEVPAGDVFDDLVWVASAKSYARSVEQMPAVADGKDLRIDLKLWPLGTVEGRVVDPKGRPLAGVRTVVDQWYLASGNAVAGPEGVVTGPDGAFRLETSSNPEGVSLRATRETGQRGFGGGGPYAVAPGGTTTVPDVVMTLNPAAVLRVTDVEGRAIPGALIESVASNPALRTFFTGGDGRVLLSFERWRTDGPAQLPAPPKVSARGFVDQFVDSFVPDASDPPEVHVVLSRATELRCHAVWADGTDAAGITVGAATATAPIATIWPLRNEPRLTDEPVEGLLGVVETDRSGRCRLTGIPAPPWHVAAWLEARDEEPAVRVESVPDASQEVLLRLPEAPPASRPAVEVVEVQVTVLDAASNKPVSDAGVFLDQRAALPAGPGVYLCSVPRAFARVAVWAQGYVRAFEKKIDFSVAGNERLEVKLDPGVTVKGRARLPADVTITGAEISVSWSDRGRRATPLLPSGEFVIRGVPAGAPLDFVVQTPYRGKSTAPWNFVPMPFESVEVPAGLREMTFDLDFVAASHVGVALSYPPSLQVDPWDMTLTGTEPAWSRKWQVSGAYFRAIVPMCSATGRCEVRGVAPIVQSFDLKSDSSYRVIRVQ